MQLELHSSEFKNSNLSIYEYMSTTEGDTRWDSVNQVLGRKFLLLFELSSHFKMLVVLVVSEIRTYCAQNKSM